MNSRKLRPVIFGALIALFAFGCKGGEPAADTTTNSSAAKTPTATPSATPDGKMATTTPPSGTDAGADKMGKADATKAGATSTAGTPERTLPDGLKIQDLTVGTGKEAVKGSAAAVHYRGSLDDGSIFDESYKRGEPFQLVLGQGMVIKGWDEGLVGMKVGGKRRLTIPPALGYGDKAQGDKIPANSTLHFDCELMDVQ